MVIREIAHELNLELVKQLSHSLYLRPNKITALKQAGVL